MKKNANNKEIIARQICKGSIDMHIHSFPDLIPRKLNDIELAQQAKNAKMAAILIKNHFESTVSRAWLVQNIIGEGTNIFGGCVLNYSVGGINPEVVETSIKLGAKEIWMPTLHARNHILKIKKQKNATKITFKSKYLNNKGIYILDKKGKLIPSVYDVLTLIAKSKIILGTGHLTLEEIIVLVKEANKLGVEKIIINHPEWWIVNMPLDLQLELSKKGVYFERCFNNLIKKDNKKISLNTMVNSIRKVGIESTILATDLGQDFNPTPILGLISYIKKLLEAGFSEKELDIMLKRNPSSLLELS